VNIWPFNIPAKRRAAQAKRNEEAAKASVARLIMLAKADAEAEMCFVNIHKNMVTVLQRSIESNLLISKMRAEAAAAKARRDDARMKAEFDELTRLFEERMKGKP